MNYNGKELVEMTPEKWDGKSRDMLVWDDESKNPIIKEIVGYTQSDIHSDNIIWIDNRGNRYSHCAEIPKEAQDMNYSIDDCIDTIKSITARSSNASWYDLYRDVITYLKSLKELKEENERLKSIDGKSIEYISNDTCNVTVPPADGEFIMWAIGYCSSRKVLVKLLVPANANRVYMGSDAWWSIRVSEAVVKGYFSTKRLDVPEEINIDETPQSSGILRGVFWYPMNEKVKPYYEFKEEGKMQDGACIPGWIRFEDAMWFAHL